MGRLLIFVLLIVACYSLEDLTNDEFYECAKCMCHGVSGCWYRENCAKYSINEEYWRDAGSPSLDETVVDSNQRYKKCMKNENCIVNTIKMYTDKYLTDCNCDGKIDCKDRLAIHLGMKNGCINPYFTKIRADRFNKCASKIGVNLMELEEAYCGSIEAE